MSALWNSLHTRLIVAFVAVAAVGIMTVSAIQAWQVGDALLTKSGALLHARAEASASLAGATLDAQVAKLHGMVISEALYEAARGRFASYPADDTAAFRQIKAEDASWPGLGSDAPLIAGVIGTPLADELRAQAELEGHTAELMLTDRRGALAAANVRTTDYYQADEEWWQRAAAGGLFISRPAYDSSNNGLNFIIAIAVYDKDNGALVGVLRSTYSIDAITARLTENSLGTGINANLLIGESILEPNKGEFSKASDENTLAIAQAKDQNYSQAEYGGQPSLIAVATIPGDKAGYLGWAVVLYQDLRETLAPVDNARLNSLGMALLVLAASAVAAFVIAGMLSAPIRLITAAAERIAAGDLAQRVGIVSGDEIGRLARGFDQMATTLQERIAGEQAAQAERLRIQQELIDAQDRRIEELAAPTIPLGNNTLLLPLIGSVDERRVERVIQTLLADVHASRAHTIIIDLSGVRDLDAQVVRALMRAAVGVSLIGAQVVLVGMRAQLARTVIALNIDLAGIPVYASIQDALEMSPTASL